MLTGVSYLNPVSPDDARYFWLQKPKASFSSLSDRSGIRNLTAEQKLNPYVIRFMST